MLVNRNIRFMLTTKQRNVRLATSVEMFRGESSVSFKFDRGFASVLFLVRVGLHSDIATDVYGNAKNNEKR